MDGRACGAYKEWHANGKLKIDSFVIEGMGDLGLECMNTWVFDKESKIYDEQGALIAKYTYEKGALEGPSFQYYPTGEILKSFYYHKNLEEGDEIYFSKEGKVLGKSSYAAGYLQGESYFLGSKDYPRFEERYQEGLLEEGHYYSFENQNL